VTNRPKRTFDLYNREQSAEIYTYFEEGCASTSVDDDDFELN